MFVCFFVYVFVCYICSLACLFIYLFPDFLLSIILTFLNLIKKVAAMGTLSQCEELKVRQRHIRRLSFVGLLVFACSILLGWMFVPSRMPPMLNLVDRLSFTLRWQTPSLLMLLSVVWVIALKRSRSRAMDPVSGLDKETVEIHLRVLQNTLEQLVLSMTSQLILTTYLQHSQMWLIPVLGVLFTVGRVTFWIGYLQPQHGRTNRGLGVAMTLIPTSLVFAYCAFRFFSDLLF